MIINVSIERVVRAHTLTAGDAQELRRAVGAVVQRQLTSETSGTPALAPATSRTLARAIAAQVTTECSRP